MGDLFQSLPRKVLHAVANGRPSADILKTICSIFEATHGKGIVAGVTLLDRTSKVFENGIFPSLDSTYGKALAGILVDDRPGSCALAVYEGRTVTSANLADDERFSDAWKKLGTAHGLEAIISIPAIHADGMALGTFVVAHPRGLPLDARTVADAHDTAALCADVMAYRREQAKQELLFGELQHRVRNIFSTIGAVVYSTLKSNREPDAFRKTLDGRLAALAKAHALALNPDETDLRRLLADTLAPYSLDHDIRLDGPRLLLSKEAAVAFSMATHELATNAAKYGSLSQSGGSVHVDWSIEKREGPPAFLLTWRERDGPSVLPPSRSGYGQRTVTRSIASAIDGKVDLDFSPDGLECQVRAPYSRRLGSRVS